MFGKPAFDSNIEFIHVSQIEKQPITCIKNKVEEEKHRGKNYNNLKIKEKQGKEYNHGIGEKDMNKYKCKPYLRKIIKMMKQEGR